MHLRVFDLAVRFWGFKFENLTPRCFHCAVRKMTATGTVGNQCCLLDFDSLELSVPKFGFQISGLKL